MLFTVDEVDPTLDEIVQLAAFYQHFVREGRKVALLMAGLPHNISSLLNNKTVSFLRRSNRRALDRIPDGEVSAALVRTAQAGNRNGADCSDGVHRRLSFHAPACRVLRLGRKSPG